MVVVGTSKNVKDTGVIKIDGSLVKEPLQVKDPGSTALEEIPDEVSCDALLPDFEFDDDAELDTEPEPELDSDADDVLLLADNVDPGELERLVDPEELDWLKLKL